MKLKLARTALKARCKSIELSKIEEMLPQKTIFYFDRENSHKDLKAIIKHFEEQECNVYMREVKYGLNENEYIYEVHIVQQ